MVSMGAVLGLKALVELSTASLVDSQGNRQLGALYVCASAYSAYNPAKGITEGSNRPVYYMPLPPLSVEGMMRSWGAVQWSGTQLVWTVCT